MDEAEVYYQRTLWNDLVAPPSYGFNLWGQEPGTIVNFSANPAHFCNLTPLGIGHSGVHDWYQANVVPTLWTVSTFFCPPSAGLAVALLGNGSSASLDPSHVTPLLAEALSRWEAAGVGTSGLGNLEVRIANLGGTTLGLASGTTIWLDDNAAGWGWFVDPTPGDDAEFTTPGDQGEQGRMDLLSVVMHELGHLLGHDHEADGLMAETLSTGTRPEAGRNGYGNPSGFAADVVFALLKAEKESANVRSTTLYSWRPKG